MQASQLLRMNASSFGEGALFCDAAPVATQWRGL